MNQITKIAVVLLAVASMVAVPYAVASDSSDAYDVTVGETGATFSLENMKTDDIDRLYSESNKNTFASSLLGKFLYYASMVYTISDVTVTEMDLSKSMSQSVTEDTIQSYNTSMMSYKLTFTATFNSSSFFASFADRTFETSLIYSKDLISTFGNDKPTADTKFEFTAVVTDVSLAENKYSYVTTDAKSFAVTESESNTGTTYAFDADVKYTRMVGTQLKTDSFKLKSTSDTDNSYTTVFDYGTVGASKAVADTSVFKKSLPEDQCSNTTYSFTCGDVSTSDELKYDLSGVFYANRGGGKWTAATSDEFLIAENIQAKPILFYGDDVSTSLFTSFAVVDTTLKTNDAMKAFLSTAGTTSEDYKDSVSASTDLFDEYEVTMKESDSGDSNVMFYVIIGVLAVVIVILVLLMILSARKQRSTIRTR